jgi:hypothetical protein
MPSIQTSPVNHSAGPFVVGCLARISTGVSLLMGWRAEGLAGWAAKLDQAPANHRRAAGHHQP